MAYPKNFNEFIGKKYNRLKILSEGKRYYTSGNHSKRTVSCLCDCGKIKDYEWQSVIKGYTLSCGCYNREKTSLKMSLRNKKHGMFGTPEYNTWQSMKKRCLNKSHKAYHYYGGRGITICDNWINSFESFFNDMGLRPNKKYSLERVNNNLGYCKDNCIWATKTQQSQNQRNNLNITYKNQTKCLAQWARDLNIPYSRLWYRIKIAKKPLNIAFYDFN